MRTGPIINARYIVSLAYVSELIKQTVRTVLAAPSRVCTTQRSGKETVAKHEGEEDEEKIMYEKHAKCNKISNANSLRACRTNRRRESKKKQKYLDVVCAAG